MKAVWLALVTLPAMAVADSARDVPARARALAEHGRICHDRGDYPAAIAAFTEAYVLAPSPALLFDVAQAYRLAGHCDDAAVMYRRYLATDPEPDARALAETQLRAVERCTPAAIASQPRADPGRTKKEVGAALGIGGGLALAGAIYYALQAHDASDQVTATYAKGGAWSSIRDVDANGQHAATMAEVFGATGAIALGAGVALYYAGVRDSRAITIVPHTDGAEVHATWHF
jgi:tetratricopeptide (TPR) repeat protein